MSLGKSPAYSDFGPCKKGEFKFFGKKKASLRPTYNTRSAQWAFESTQPKWWQNELKLVKAVDSRLILEGRQGYTTKWLRHSQVEYWKNLLFVSIFPMKQTLNQALVYIVST